MSRRSKGFVYEDDDQQLSSDGCLVIAFWLVMCLVIPVLCMLLFLALSK